MSYGLATRICDDPRAAAFEIAREIAGKSPDAIRAAKRMLNKLSVDPGSGAARRVRRAAEADRQLQPDRGRPRQYREARAAVCGGGVTYRHGRAKPKRVFNKSRPSTSSRSRGKAWITGTSPVMTENDRCSPIMKTMTKRPLLPRHHLRRAPPRPCRGRRPCRAHRGRLAQARRQARATASVC